MRLLLRGLILFLLVDLLLFLFLIINPATIKLKKCNNSLLARSDSCFFLLRSKRPLIYFNVLFQHIAQKNDQAYINTNISAGVISLPITFRLSSSYINKVVGVCKLKSADVLGSTKCSIKEISEIPVTIPKNSPVSLEIQRDINSNDPYAKECQVFQQKVFDSLLDSDGNLFDLLSIIFKRCALTTAQLYY